MGNSNLSAGCQLRQEDDLAGNRPTIRQAAERLLDALDSLDAGADPDGVALGEVRHELRVLLASTPSRAVMLTGADFDPAAFEAIWRSDAVRIAGMNYGWRGIAEAVWAAALEEARGARPAR